MHHFQVSVRDLLCLFSLLAVVIGGVADRMHDLPMQTTFLHRVAIQGPIPAFTSVPERVRLPWYRVLIGGIIAALTTVIASFFLTRLILGNATVSRIAAAVTCMAFLAAFWLIGMAVLHGNYSQVFESELKANLWEAARSRSVAFAAAAATVVVAAEGISYLRAVRRSVP